MLTKLLKSLFLDLWYILRFYRRPWADCSKSHYIYPYKDKINEIVKTISKNGLSVRFWFNEKTGYVEILNKPSYFPPIAKIKVRGEMGCAYETEIRLTNDFPDDMKKIFGEIIPKEIPILFLPL